MDVSADYEEIKRAILRTYESIPEAYRQKFRDLKKVWNQRYAEIAYEKGVLLDRWCAAEKVEEDFRRFRELILIEEFKGCVPDDIRTYLNEKSNKSISEFARFADEYALTHKTKFSSNKSYQKDRRDGRESSPAEAEIQLGASCKSKEEERQAGRRVPSLTCFNCETVGHIASKCFAPRKETGKGNAAVPTGCIVSISKLTRKAQVDKIREGREKFISEGTVSVKEGETPVPVRIWRDTGAEQSLILGKVPDFGPETGEVVLRGIGKGTEAVPLHGIIINCDLVSGPVEIGVWSELPRDSMDVLLGNDLAGGEVCSAVKLTSKPVSVEDPPIDSKIYPACAITHSMSRKAAEKETVLNQSSVDLAETFLPTLYQDGLEDGKTENREVEESKGEEVDLPLAKREFIEVKSKDEKQIRQLEGPGLDMDDLSGLTELFEEVEKLKCVPDNDIRAVLDEKDAVTLKDSAGLADEVVLTRRVEFTLDGSCPESNWEDQGNLEFEKGTGMESLEEVDVQFECVQGMDAHGTEPSNETQEKSEVSDLVEKECILLGQMDLVQ
ncbi:uncharacterized protein LOC132400698 [Hypanus sabinus]|uniref:uncharacterized protein LOC132400698 n=1 Tax=Hypanus sabinus TaxID=79690 RepID=UPI0028C3B641|nr:uncharacterized protein LOC132400698 [Hypanus sabinus]XP_059837929.1 uncharacterized protein LOC132400698 [Hypanus sabinus]XP_059837939.1 uncharacterized protein LOC132400698 [Hypanus sabinus]XP_059837950.1 uncharacterized protein LOC132400698 [Hypanus sabinus]XP_059837960.1 uncharacterized protein LOC132400698 [Hypanus sabinus]